MAAAAERTPGGRLVSLAVLAAFLLGVLWLASALHVSRSLERCLPVGCSVWGDECCFSIRWAGTAAVIALAFAVALAFGEAARRRERLAEAGGAQGKDEGRPGRAPERGRVGAAAIHALAFSQIYLIAAVPILLGKAVRSEGADHLEEHPADQAAARLFQSGHILYNAGYLALSVVHCCSVIPYMLLRLVWFVREKCVGSTLAA